MALSGKGYGGKFLMEAAKTNDTETIRILLRLGIDIDEVKNNKGWTALMVAAGSGKTETIRVLLNAGADVNARGKYGYAALMVAAGNGQTEAIRELLNAGADVNATGDDGWTALMKAARYGQTEAIRELLNAGADVNATDDDGWTALIVAARYGQTEAIHELLKAGADVEIAGANIFALKEWEEQAQAREAYDYDERAQYYEERTRYYELQREAEIGTIEEREAREEAQREAEEWEEREAQAREAEEWAEAREAAKARYSNLTAFDVWHLEQWHLKQTDVNRPDFQEISELLRPKVEKRDDGGITALMRAAARGQTEAVRELVKGGADIEERNKYGNTALMYAARGGQTEAMRELVKAGANVNTRDNKGWTALMGAVIPGRIEVIRVLLEAGVDVNAKYEKYGRTALMYAAGRKHAGIRVGAQDPVSGKRYAYGDGRPEIIRELVKAGADIEVRDHLGWTALMRAAMLGRTGAIRELVKAGADVNARDNNGGGTSLIRAASGGMRTEAERQWATAHMQQISPGEGQAEAIRVLLEAGADKRARDNKDRTAFDWWQNRHKNHPEYQEISDLLHPER